jgi:hypothetical protein
MSLIDRFRRKFARPPQPVRAAVEAAGDAEERILAWGALARGEGWLVATSRGLRSVPAEPAGERPVLGWHEVGHARWSATADGGGSFEVVRLTEVEPGVQAREPAERYVLSDAGDLPATVRRRVDQTVIASRRSALPGRGGVLVVARRIPGQPAREWTVIFDDDADRNDPAARDVAREKLAEALATDQPD